LRPFLIFWWRGAGNSGWKVFTGCNIESASFGLTVCAERVAIWKALSEGERNFTALAIVADTESLTPPCGTCRQIIWEFCKEATITLTNLRGGREVVTIRDLLPRAFDARFLKEVHEGSSPTVREGVFCAL